MKDTEILSAAYIIWNDLFNGFEKIKQLYEERQNASRETDKVRLDKELRVALSKVNSLGGQIIQMDEIISKPSKGTLA